MSCSISVHSTHKNQKHSAIFCAEIKWNIIHVNVQLRQTIRIEFSVFLDVSVEHLISANVAKSSYNNMVPFRLEQVFHFSPTYLQQKRNEENKINFNCNRQRDARTKEISKKKFTLIALTAAEAHPLEKCCYRDPSSQFD